MGIVACLAGIDRATIERLKEDPDLVESYLYPDDGESEPPNCIDLDKSWHCIHFMLTGQAEDAEPPLGWAVVGDEEVGEDTGNGPARVLSPEQVSKVSSALIDEEAFRRRFDPTSLAQANIYLHEMCVRDGDDALDYIVDNYRGLVDFYRNAAARGDGAILWFC
jgi:hypothetical protein